MLKTQTVDQHQDKIFNARKDTYTVSDTDAGFSKRRGCYYRLFFGIIGVNIPTFDTRRVQVQHKKSSSMTSFTCHNIDMVQ